MFILWCSLTQSSESGEEDEGWPTYEADAAEIARLQNNVDALLARMLEVTR
jgi:hypothetical protein